MIRGTLNARLEAIVELRVRGPAGSEVVAPAVVDTGYTACLMLPSALVASLGLVRQSSSSAVLGDGSVVHFDVYSAEIEWDGIWTPVLVSAVGNEVLLGMRQLAGHELRLAVVPGGGVQISRLP